MDKKLNRPPITELLVRANQGDDGALGEVFDAVYSELRRLAHAQRRKQVKPGETLSTTALVHETYLKLGPGANSNFSDREHFMAIAAKAMRQILVDSARRRHRQKRGGGFVIGALVSDPPEDPLYPEAETLLAVDTALTELRSTDERLHTVIECRFFGGMTQCEIASLLSCSERSIRRDWIKARAWLRLHLDGGSPSPATR